MSILGDAGKNAGSIAVEKINSETLPHVAQMVNDTLGQVAVVTNGLLTGIEGERLLAMQGLKDDVIGPVLAELAEWRKLLAGGFEGTVNGNIPFTIRAIPPKT